MPAVPPQVSRRTIEALLATHASGLRDRSLVLVHGRYAAGAPPEFTTTVGGRTRRVRVSDQTSVLGVLEAWQNHRGKAGSGDLLVVTTGVDDTQLGWDLRGRAVRRRTLTVDNAEIVLQRFGATSLDIRMYQESWLLEALLDAEPAVGWWRTGAVLTRDAALRDLVVARLGLAGPDASAEAAGRVSVDADALLAWSRTPAGPLRFAELPERERTELKKWLGETAGPAVPVLMSLAEAGRGQDAMALGLLGAALRDPAAGPDVVLTVGGLFGQVMPRRTDLRAFTEAVEGTLIRWIGEAESTPTARQRVFAVLERADELARDAGLTAGLKTSRFLPSSFTAQLREVAAAACRSPRAADAALVDLTGHALVRLVPDRVRAAEMAVRIARWLDEPETEPAVISVAAGVRDHLADWGWADRALTVLWAGDPGGDPVTGQELRVLYEAGRDRRKRLDEEFARRLVPWTAHATAQHPDGCLVVENILEEAVRPLAADAAPLVLLLDGMSSAVAAQLGEEVEREGWREVAPRAVAGQRRGRLAAVSMLPSVTETSRASLLTGTAAKGGQSVEASGFGAFWKQRRREALLFHKAAIGGGAGHFLSEEIIVALASEAVVGAVLNTIDDSLDSGQQGQRTQWSLGDITYLRELLAAAKGYGRPVVLVADHGHVLERGAGDGPASADGGAPSARWRTGTPGDGESLLAGPRVLEGDGAIVAPWREDIRYTGRRAGYHGGAAAAEVTVPVLVLVPTAESVPQGWDVLPREQATPSWWRAPIGDHPATAVGAEPVSVQQKQKQKQKQKPKTSKRPSQTDGLFTDADVVAPGQGSVREAPAAATLGVRVVTSEVYQAQKEYVRKAPEAKVVAAVVDALVTAGGTMSPAALAAEISATGRVRRNIDGFIATVQRLLNVEGYPVLGFIDAGHTVKLDVTMVRDQFLPKEST